MKTKWTDEQIKAIETKGNNLLVSAAAGAGKTAVLVERIMRKITDKDHPMDINRLLTVTFTNAAASEMKERVKNRLYDLLESDPENALFQRQFALIEKANITTVHSFCSKIVRENFHLLKLDSDFRLAETSETSMIFDETLDRLFEKLYTNEILPGFTVLVDTYGYGKDDRRLKELVKTMYEFTRSCPDTVGTLEKAVGEYNVSTEEFEFSKTVWGKILIGDAKDNLDYIKMEMEGLVKDLADLPVFRSDEEILKTDIKSVSTVTNFLDRIAEGSIRWDELPTVCDSVSFARLKPIKGEFDESIHEQVKKTRQIAKDLLSALSKRAADWSNDRICEVMNKQYPVLKTLCETVRLLEDEFFKAKKSRSVLDFSDLEHLALKILYKKTEAGLVPSDIAREYSEKFDEILIDEYQDSNYVQEAILTSVSGKKKNIFMVGDVKQSIYRFRQSMPILFLEKFAAYSQKETPDSDSPGILVKLYKNFRSDLCVIEGVNRIFERIMTGGIFEINYTDEEKLILGLEENDQIDDQNRTEIVVVDTSRLGELFQDEEKPMNCIPEARTIAKIIRQMVDSGFEIKDTKKNETRKVQYNDFAVLTRVKSNWAQPFTDEMVKCGVPAYCDAGGGYYESIEVNTILALLRIIDNPLQDIYMASVLLSPIGDFTKEELAKIRLIDREKNIYHALTESIMSNSDPGTVQKAGAFCAKLNRWRELAGEIPVDELIWHLYVETGYLDYVTALPEGTKRNGNLKLLYEKAKTLKNMGWNGVYQFIRYIDKSILSEKDSPGIVTLGDNENVVRVMTIHKSKGLEFPVVFVAGCGKGFNLRTESSQVVMHHKNGIGADFTDPKLRYSCNTLQKEALLIKHREESLAEEMRVLYVAGTRARNKLFFVGCSKNLQGLIDQCRLLEKLNIRRIPQAFLAKSRTFLEWILLGIWKNPSVNQQDGSLIFYDFPFYRLRIEQPFIPEPVEEENIEQSEEPDVENSVMERVKELLDWEYPYSDYAKVPAKVSVTELKRLDKNVPDDEETLLIEDDPSFKEPVFLMEENRYVNYGNVVHYIYQHIDVEKLRQNPDHEVVVMVIEDLIQDMVRQGVIKPEQKEVLQSRRLASFFETKPGREWLTCDEYRREMPFYLRLDPAEYYAVKGERLCDTCEGMAPVLLQGIIDLWYVKDNEITVVDYKTDRIFDDVTETFRERYGVQLSLYKKALEKITGKKVKKTYIYAVSMMKLISI